MAGVVVGALGFQSCASRSSEHGSWPPGPRGDGPRAQVIGADFQPHGPVLEFRSAPDLTVAHRSAPVDSISEGQVLLPIIGRDGVRPGALMESKRVARDRRVDGWKHGSRERS